MAAPDQYAALALIAAGGVSADQHESIFVPASVDLAVVGELRLLIVVAMARSLACRTAMPSEPGVHPVVLTALGEAVLRRSNVADYQSRHTFGVRDEQVSVTEVRS